MSNYKGPLQQAEEIHNAAITFIIEAFELHNGIAVDNKRYCKSLLTLAQKVSEAIHEYDEYEVNRNA